MQWRGLEIPKRLICDLEHSTNTYGRFIAEPFERGYGITIGNSLRRILLSSLEGAAVTSVRIEGALHEFSTLPGVFEDTTEIILNIKQLNIKLHSEHPKQLRIEAKGQCEVTASDIIADNEVEILNPNLHIAALDKEGKLIMEMEATKGRGYSPVERNKKENQAIGFIFMDSFFSPVKKVNCTVENTRVGQRTDFDRLILDVWTNGTVTPQDAVIEAADILTRHLNIFIGFQEEPEEEEVEDVTSDEEKKRREYLNMSVKELELSVRASNCLDNARIALIKELVQKTEVEMLQYRNFGKKSLNEIKETLSEMGLSFGMKIDKEGNII